MPAVSYSKTEGKPFVTAKFQDGYEAETDVPANLLQEDGTLKSQHVIQPDKKPRNKGGRGRGLNYFCV